jgi:hypothetical protein
MSCPLFQDYTDCRIEKRKERGEQQSSSTIASPHSYEESPHGGAPTEAGTWEKGSCLGADATSHELLRNFTSQLLCIRRAHISSIEDSTECTVR